MATEAELKAAAQRALAAGDVSAAEELAQAAMALRDAATTLQAATPAPPKPGIATRARDWMTGANRDEGIPSALAAGLGLPAAKAAQMTALLASTVSDERMQRGLMEIEPEVQFGKDSNGKLTAIFPVRNEAGEVVGRNQFYPNAPGLDLTDVMIGSGAAAMASPIGRVAKAVGLPVTGALGGAVIGGAEAGIVEGISSGLTNSQFQYADVPLGAAGGALGGKAADVIGEVVARLTSRPARLIDANGQLLPAVRAEIERLGLDPDQIGPEVVARIRAETGRSMSPVASAAVAEAQALPVPVPLTRGQATGIKGQQLLEDALRSGAYGEGAAALITGQNTRAQAALRANLDRMAEGISPGPAVRGAGGEAAQAALVGQRQAAETGARELYEAARAAPPTFVPKDVAANISDTLAAEFRSGFSPRTAPMAAGLLQDLDGIIAAGDNVDIRALMDWRQVASNAAKGNTPDAAAAGKMAKLLDTQLADAADNALLSGGPEAVGMWQAAIKNYKTFAETWRSQTGILNALTGTTTRDGAKQLIVAPESAANYIFGVSANSMASKTSIVRDLATLRNRLPEAEWNALRQEAFIRLANTAEGRTDNVAGTTFAGAWRKLNRDNPELVRVLFTEGERTMIARFASVANKIAGAAANTSNTASSAAGMIQKIGAALGSTNIGQFAMRVPMLKAITEAVGGARAFSAIRSPVPRAMTGANLAGIGAGSGAAVANREELDNTASGIMGMAR